jgi:hypothetical protein
VQIAPQAEAEAEAANVHGPKNAVDKILEGAHLHP